MLTASPGSNIRALCIYSVFYNILWTLEIGNLINKFKSLTQRPPKANLKLKYHLTKKGNYHSPKRIIIDYCSFSIIYFSRLQQYHGSKLTSNNAELCAWIIHTFLSLKKSKYRWMNIFILGYFYKTQNWNEFMRNWSLTSNSWYYPWYM